MMIVEQLMRSRALIMLQAGQPFFVESQRNELAHWLANSIMGSDGDPTLAKQLLKQALRDCEGVAKTGRHAIKRGRA